MPRSRPKQAASRRAPGRSAGPDRPDSPDRPAGPAGRPRDAKRSRGAILAAASREFSDKGLGGARVDEIAARAGVNKALLYHYFGNKDSLFTAVLERAYEGIRSAEAALDLESLAPRGAMRRLVDFTFDYFQEHPDFIRLLNSENLHRAEHLNRSERIRALHFPLVERIGELLERGAAEGSFRKGVDPVALYVTIASLGYFYLSNAHTLGAVFGRDLLAKRALSNRRTHIRQVVEGYLRPESAA
jgi:AcrR family transcriptional regulator